MRILELAKKVNQSNPEIDFFQERIRGRVPTQVFSEFLTNKEQGDWAEDLILELLNLNLENFYPTSYGRSDSLIAGEEGFKEFYEGYQDELDDIGKCPDILIFDNEKDKELVKGEIDKEKPRKDVVNVVQKASAGLEVRSSAFLVGKYDDFMKVKGKDFKGRKNLSFTVKIEDISVVIKWIERHGVPHYYVQVFFDRIYVIAFEKILEILSNPKNHKTKYFIEKNAKNQFKSTIHINLDEGECIGKDFGLPKHKSGMKELPRGRVLSYVHFFTDVIPDVKKEDLLNVFDLNISNNLPNN
tara:strand:+ start:604 stop:1500 length:897 start_codon:yes stop_codon:yes gene_type:complete